MKKSFVLEYWLDDGWYVGKLKEVPGVFSQGETMEELEKNIREVYELVMKDQPEIDILTDRKTKDILLEVA